MEDLKIIFPEGFNQGLKKEVEGLLEHFGNPDIFVKQLNTIFYKYKKYKNTYYRDNVLYQDQRNFLVKSLVERREKTKRLLPSQKHSISSFLFYLKEYGAKLSNTYKYLKK